MMVVSNDKFYKIFQLTELPTIKDNKNVVYYNVPAGFDIEATSFYVDDIHDSDMKRAIMYHWQFGIGEIVTFGRTWEQFEEFTQTLHNILNLGADRRLIVYVHNLQYEFQFMRKRFDWEKVFLLDDRKPVYARTNGLEFRCSLKLSGGKSLENIGRDLQKHSFRKLTGDLDYEVLRSPETPLSDKERAYCENDILVLTAYIAEKIEQDGDITKIPLTNTGYVRNYCRKRCYSNYSKYRRMITQLTIEPDEYSQLKQAFAGGHTHANARMVGKVLKNVDSYDFKSSYPAVMCVEKFPMSKGNRIDRKLSDEEFAKYISTKACMFDLIMEGVISKRTNEHVISASKCWLREDSVLDNGRIVMAGKVGLTVTEQDFITIMNFYNVESFSIKRLVYYEKQYLPHPFVQSVLNLFEKKTKLDGVAGEHVNYMISKNMLNSTFGMSVTNPVRDILEYDGMEYHKEKADVAEAIERYNNNKRRFLFYPWGVWITAYARRNLFTGIEEIGDDYIYSDTDSLKILNGDSHKKYFDDYNEVQLTKIKKASEYHRLPEDVFMPCSPKGDRKILGIWDYEGRYDEFKTLGAKRYLYRVGDEYHLTLAGANKRKTRDFLINSKNPFGNFDNTLVVPPDYSGRMTLTYIDEPTDGILVDCNGSEYHYHEESSIHMEKSEYSLTMSNDFLNYLKGVQDIE